MQDAATTSRRLEEPTRHHTVREGLRAGGIGALAVAAWFFVIDMAAGQPLQTPMLLGDAVLAALRFGEVTFLASVMVYTLVHVIAFMVFGVIAVALVHAAMRDISMLYGIVVLFVIFESAFYLLAFALDLSLLGALGWMNVTLANLIAALVMGTFLWRTHPSLHGRVREGLSGVGSV